MALSKKQLRNVYVLIRTLYPTSTVLHHPDITVEKSNEENQIDLVKIDDAYLALVIVQTESKKQTVFFREFRVYVPYGMNSEYHMYNNLSHQVYPTYGQRISKEACQDLCEKHMDYLYQTIGGK